MAATVAVQQNDASVLAIRSGIGIGTVLYFRSCASPSGCCDDRERLQRLFQSAPPRLVQARTSPTCSVRSMMTPRQSSDQRYANSR
jgi:hypothetical protein